MRTYKRKTVDEWQIWTNYGHGWEEESAYETRAEAYRDLPEYQRICGARVRKVRVPLIPKVDRCAHKPIRQYERPFVHTVAVTADQENRAAHGSIRYDEVCEVCKARRAVNQNGSHFEHGPWILPS